MNKDYRGPGMSNVEQEPLEQLRVWAVAPVPPPLLLTEKFVLLRTRSTSWLSHLAHFNSAVS
jgi:hypothetical protein